MHHLITVCYYLTILSVLAGGTGSIKLIRGLAARKKDIVVICNVGDNIWMHGLYVCPDIDTITYGLADMLDKKRGWGIKGDSFHCLAQMKRIGVPTWFGLGDRDLATHLIRTNMMKNGKSLSDITNFFRKCYSISAQLIPATDGDMTTSIVTSTRGNNMHLQEFWVKHKGRPAITGVRYNNARSTTANPAALESIKQCQAVIIAPANPVSSIGAITALPDLRKALMKNRNKVMAISPLVGRKAVSGPAVKYMRTLGLENSSLGVAKYYRDFVSKFIVSIGDHGMKSHIEALDMQVYETNTTMNTRKDEIRLASYVLKLIENRLKS